MEDKAVQFVATKCMSDGGDARKALDMAATAVKARLDRLGDDTTSTPGPLISFSDLFVINKARNRGLLERIKGLPDMSKSCLVALCALGQVQVTETTIGKLKRFVAQCTVDEDEIIEAETFTLTLETLKDSGLLQLGAASLNGMSARETMNVVLRLGYQLDDVQSALNKVCKGDFYHNIARLAQQYKGELAAK